MSAQGIEYSYAGRADVKWMRRLSGKNRTEFSPRVPIDSQILPFCPLSRVISYLRHCGGTRFSNSVPLCPIPAFPGVWAGHASAADTSRGAVRPAQASSAIDRTHDHILSKTKGLGKRQMLSGLSNAIALGQTLTFSNHGGTLTTAELCHWPRAASPQYDPAGMT